MVNEQIITYCLSKPGAYIDFPFGPEVVVIKVRKRIFTQLFDLKGKPMATFNCNRITGEYYRSLYPNTVSRGYHCPPVQHPYFNTVNLDGTVPDDEFNERLRELCAKTRALQRLHYAFCVQRAASILSNAPSVGDCTHH